MKYTIIRDTREKDGEGWTWEPSQYCQGTIKDTIQTGDYTIRGYENLVTLERKGSISEWAKNIYERRVEAELERMEGIKYPFILLEFNLSDIIQYPVGSSIPRRLWPKLRITSQFILMRTVEFMVNHKVKILFCGKQGKTIASSIFKRMMELIADGRHFDTTNP